MPIAARCAYRKPGLPTHVQPRASPTRTRKADDDEATNSAWKPYEIGQEAHRGDGPRPRLSVGPAAEAWDGTPGRFELARQVLEGDRPVSSTTASSLKCRAVRMPASVTPGP